MNAFNAATCRMSDCVMESIRMELYEPKIQDMREIKKWTIKITLLYLYHMIQFSNITPASVVFPQYLHDCKCDIDFVLQEPKQEVHIVF